MSRKGDEHSPHIRMLIAAGLPTWAAYTKLIADEFEVSVRTVQRRLEAHRGYPKENQPPSPLTDALKNLADARKELGGAAAGGDEQAAAIIEQYAKAVSKSAEVVPGPSTPTSTTPAVLSYEERDRGDLRYFAKRLNKIGIGLQQFVDEKKAKGSKYKWSKYAEYAEVVAFGKKIAGLVKLLWPIFFGYGRCQFLRFRLVAVSRIEL